MMLRTLLSLSLLLALAAAPAFAIGVSAGVGEGGIATGSQADLHVSAGQEVTSPTAGPVTDCSASLRSFRQRNTIQPSKRRAALRACRNEAARDAWAARTR